MVPADKTIAPDVRFLSKRILANPPPVKEEWRRLTTYPDYEANNMGEVREVGAKFPLPWWWDERGYRRCAIWNGGTRPKQVPIHRLVADAFLPPPIPPRDTINHIDGVKDNNWAENLEWATQQEQADHAMKLGLWEQGRQRGEANTMSKLTEAQVREIRALQGTMRHADIAAKFGVSKTMVQHINTGKAWKHVK